ncbi:MAG TPA: crosslink repair DNA glycosylase YcaQ family protein [Rhizomicrobium sp.]|nr:crosslink repair DNA glycosylase YcaQ family protein [Rhizomicrobium sp.]
MSTLVIFNSAARRLFLYNHALGDRPAHRLAHHEVLSLVRRLGFVQLDSINVVERAHHMILFSRASGYARERLAALHQEHRALFEHWTHDASLLPIEFYPYWHHRFRTAKARLSDSNWQARFGGAPQHAIARVRRRIRKEGALAARDFEDKGQGSWWGWGPSKTALEYLWRAGELAVARRDGFEKIYDLAERVIPADLRAERPTRKQTVDWACREALGRLGFATPSEIANFFDLVDLAEARLWAKAALRQKKIMEVTITGANGEMKASLAYRSIESAIENLRPPPIAPRFLSPFDPVIRDRKRALRLFGFDYTIEVFVPRSKRRYGYYVLPILEGERFIGRADLKAHRDEKGIEVRGLWSESGVVLDKPRQAAIESALAELARFAANGGA